MEGMKYCLMTKSRRGEQHGAVLILMPCYMLNHIREEVIKLNEQFSHLKSLKHLMPWFMWNQFSPPLPCCSTKEGHSVCCHFHGFEPYFYINYSPRIAPDDISRFHRILEGRMGEVTGTAGYQNSFAVLKWCRRGVSCMISSRILTLSQNCCCFANNGGWLPSIRQH